MNSLNNINKNTGAIMKLDKQKGSTRITRNCQHVKRCSNSHSSKILQGLFERPGKPKELQVQDRTDGKRWIVVKP